MGLKYQDKISKSLVEYIYSVQTNPKMTLATWLKKYAYKIILPTRRKMIKNVRSYLNLNLGFISKWLKNEHKNKNNLINFKPRTSIFTPRFKCKTPLKLPKQINRSQHQPKFKNTEISSWSPWIKGGYSKRKSNIEESLKLSASTEIDLIMPRRCAIHAIQHQQRR